VRNRAQACSESRTHLRPPDPGSMGPVTMANNLRDHTSAFTLPQSWGLVYSGLSHDQQKLSRCGECVPSTSPHKCTLRGEGLCYASYRFSVPRREASDTQREGKQVRNVSVEANSSNNACAKKETLAWTILSRLTGIVGCYDALGESQGHCRCENGLQMLSDLALVQTRVKARRRTSLPAPEHP
jgi:hypothetical protein